MFDDDEYGEVDRDAMWRQFCFLDDTSRSSNPFAHENRAHVWLLSKVGRRHVIQCAHPAGPRI
jgi:hypothetical protein